MKDLRTFLQENSLINRSELAKQSKIERTKLIRFINGKSDLKPDEAKNLTEIIKPFGFSAHEIVQTPENTAKSEHKGFDPNKLIRRTPEEARKAKEQESKGAPSWWYGGKSETLNGRIARANARNEGKDTTKKPDKEKIKQAQEIINKSK